MPVAKGGRPPLRQIVILGFGLVSTFFVMAFIVTQSGQLTSSDNLGVGDVEPVFRPGNVDRLSTDIAQLGPLLFPDLTDGDRDIYLTHVGEAPTEGWRAFSVRPPSASRDCFVEWQETTGDYVDICDGTVYPPSGEGLSQLPVDVDADGEITVHLG